MKRPSFSEINALVESLVPEPGRCAFGPFNAYKLFQHAVAAYALDNQRALIDYKLHWPVALQQARYLAKSLKGYSSPPILKPLVFRDDARRGYDEQGIRRSFYMHRLREDVGSERATLMAQPLSPPEDTYDVTRAQIDALRSAPLSREERGVLRELQILAARTSNWLPAEVMPYLYSAFQVFFESFHQHYQFFRNQPTQHFVMTTHYHNEGEIAAARLSGIRVIEVQHGLISPFDVYYCYTEALREHSDKALFADDIIVFGKYWKNTLLSGAGYNDTQIHVAGDYTIDGLKQAAAATGEKENKVLICAQKNLSGDYIPYLRFLLKLVQEKHPDWEVWVKLHPLERDVDRYMAFNDESHCHIIGKDGDLNALLNIAKIQVTIYSTTLYDALGKDVVNFALQDYGKFSDYAASMIDSGVAWPLLHDEDPIQKFQQLKDTELPLKREDVYAPFSPDVFQAIVS